MSNLVFSHKKTKNFKFKFIKYRNETFKQMIYYGIEDFSTERIRNEKNIKKAQ